MKRVIIILLAIVSQQAVAQIADDALILSRWHHEGSARYTAMGGAFTALGGDLSSATTNPAGIGLYRGSDFSFSVAGNLNKTIGSYLGTDLPTHHYRMNMPTFGVALSSPNYRNLQSGEGPNSWTFAIGYNQIHTFNRAFGIESINNNNSFLDAGIVNPNSTDMYLFFRNSYDEPEPLIYDDNGWTHDYLNGGYGAFQEGYFTEKGGIGEYYLSFAANFMDDIYIGATLGVQSIYLNRTLEFTETSTPTNDNYLNYFDYSQSLTTRGMGANFKAGIIYAPIYWLKLAAAIHTPTTYKLADELSDDLAYELESGNYSKSSSVTFPEYNILTPFRLMGGASFLIMKTAIIGIDYEFIDYSSAQISSSGDSFSDINSDISNFYKATHSFKLGAEYKIAMLALRAGGYYYASPYENDLFNKNNYQLGYSAGIGFRSGSYYFDIAYSRTMENFKYNLYEYSSGNGVVNYSKASIDSKMSKIIGTIGFRF